MNTARATLQVGILVILASALFIAGYLFFESDRTSSQSYLLTVAFDNAGSIRKGAEIDYSGVMVGSVESVKLDNATGKAIVKIRINKDTMLPIGSTFTIDSSLLGGASSMDIMPPRNMAAGGVQYYHPGASVVIAGSKQLDITQLQAQASVLMNNANIVMGNTNVLLKQFAQTTKNADLLLAKLTATTQSTQDFITNSTARRNLDATMVNMNQLSGQELVLADQLKTMMAQDNKMLLVSMQNINDTTGDFKQLADQNKAKVNEMIATLNDTTAKLNQTMTTTQKFVDSQSAIFTNGNTTQNMSATMANLKDASAKLNQIAADVQGITGDKQVQADLKETLHNTAQASANANTLLVKLDSLAGKHGHPILPTFKPDLSFTENFHTSHFRTDFNVLASMSNSQNFLQLGIRDISEHQRYNLEYGERYNRRVSYRAGVFNSKIALGADYNLFGQEPLSVDLYDPNNVQLDVHQRIPLGKDYGLWVGAEDIVHSPGVTLGFDLRH